MRARVGGAPVSWGVWFSDDALQPPWRQFLDEVARAGYEWIELGPYGYLPSEPATLRRELEMRGLKVAGSAIEGILYDPGRWPRTTSLGPRTLAEQLDGVGPLLAELGAKYLLLIDNTYTEMRTGEPIAPAELDAEQWRRLIETTHLVAEAARSRFGLKLLFHPETESHVEFEPQIEALLAATDPDLVSLCLDVGHHANCGGEPVAFLRKHRDRIPYLHLKSIDAAVSERVKKERIGFAPAVGMGLFVEPSEGSIDMRAIRDVLIESDFDGWVIVEHDMYPAPFDKPFPIAQHTRRYLEKIGLG
jgi:inosose dehydratase